MIPVDSQLEHRLIQRLQYGLIASCQPVDGGPMDKVEHIVAMARAAVAGGARGLRIEGIENVRAVSAVLDVPIVGIVKKALHDSDVRITPHPDDIDALADAGANIIAFDATLRSRPWPAAELLQRIHRRGCIAMADCAEFSEGIAMARAGCSFIGSTLSGYIDPSATPEEPDLALVRQWADEGLRVVAEGRYNSPALAAEAIVAGAWAVTVGSAITRVEHIAGWFSQSIAQAAQQP